VVSPAREWAFRILRRAAKGAHAFVPAPQVLTGAPDLPGVAGETEGLSTRDAALAEAIALGCLRFQSQLDFLIGHFSGRAQSRLDEEVRIALRMGIFQLRYLDRVPAHAAVAESVELVKRARKRSAAPLVNAVLRKVNRDPVEWPNEAVELSVPAWMFERWREHYGAEAARAIARAALEEPEAFVNPATGRQQDIGAQSIVPLLEIEPGMRVLDLCAAPGNKTAQALAAGARVIACDLYPHRLAAVPAEAARVVLDATEKLPFQKKFDRILIDAPCSGTGTLARNPEIKWRLQPHDLGDLHIKQVAILRAAVSHLARGGRAVYSTCSLEPEENDAVVDEVLAGSHDLRLLDVRDELNRLRDAGELALEDLDSLVSSKFLRTIPGMHPCDGFFAAVLEKLSK
jgi:16S rRNA (cytosine967-C5)-methyltransferase